MQESLKRDRNILDICIFLERRQTVSSLDFYMVASFILDLLGVLVMVLGLEAESNIVIWVGGLMCAPSIVILILKAVRAKH